MAADDQEVADPGEVRDGHQEARTVVDQAVMGGLEVYSLELADPRVGHRPWLLL